MEEVTSVEIQLTLRATADASYRSDYHNKLRGRYWRALTGERYDQIHEGSSSVGLAFSNIYPPRDIEEGDRRYARVASPDPAVLDDIVAHFGMNREFDIGTMRFRVEEISGEQLDVGETGATGTLETVTGFMCGMTREVAKEYGLDTSEITNGESETRLFWRPEHGMAPIYGSIQHSLDLSHDRFGNDRYRSPLEVDEPLFASVEPIKNDITYAIKFQPVEDETLTVILSKWELGYRVRDPEHRYHLNLALDCGIGQRREYGFGFLNLREKTTPGGTRYEY